MADALQELSSIRAALGDLPQRLATVLHYGGPLKDSSSRFVRGGAPVAPTAQTSRGQHASLIPLQTPVQNILEQLIGPARAAPKDSQALPARAFAPSTPPNRQAQPAPEIGFRESRSPAPTAVASPLSSSAPGQNGGAAIMSLLTLLLEALQANTEAMRARGSTSSSPSPSDHARQVPQVGWRPLPAPPRGNLSGGASRSFGR